MERSEAIKVLSEISCRGCKSLGRDNVCMSKDIRCFEAKKMAIEALSEAPRMHGHWIDEGPYSKELGGTLNGFIYKCSCCENAFIAPYKFCPGCGAKMDGEQ